MSGGDAIGFGDDFIVTSIVKKAYAKHNKPICVGDGRDIKWEEVFDNNPKLSKAVYPGAVWVNNVMFNRPYIDNLKTTPERVVYNPNFKAEPGEIFLTDAERGRFKDSGFIYIEPNIKGSFGGNKDWGFEKWQEVVKHLPYRFIQGKGRKLDGVEQIQTGSFREACALLERSDFFVGTDGGLHHAAAALGKRAVVVWGGLVSPKILGYDAHINLHSGTHSCGSPKACAHCRKALDWITVDMVCDAIRSLAQ
jgi:ADP-heptose:LPS heptosyltransferase